MNKESKVIVFIVAFLLGYFFKEIMNKCRLVEGMEPSPEQGMDPSPKQGDITSTVCSISPLKSRCTEGTCNKRNLGVFTRDTVCNMVSGENLGRIGQSIPGDFVTIDGVNYLLNSPQCRADI